MNSYKPNCATFPYPIKAIILDYGDVISLPADPAVMAWMASVFEVPLERFRHTYNLFRHEYDRGTFGGVEYWKKVGEANGVELRDEQIAELRQADVRMWGRLNESVLHWAKELHAAGYKTAVLSNMHQDMVEHLRGNGPWTRNFDYVVLSAPLGMAKPEPEIFQHCLRGLGVSADEAMFIDDREANIEAAVRLGMMGVVAPTSNELRNTLEAIGFKPLPQV